MKEKITFIIIVILVVFLVNTDFQRNKVSAARVTLGQYEQKLREFKTQAEQNKQAINRTQNEINTANNRVVSLKTETLKLVEEVNLLNEEIDKFKTEIENKITDTKHIIEYMQMIEGDNLYLNYVLKAETVSDIIDREMIIKQLIDYNNKSIGEMETIIKGNIDRQKKIDQRQISIEKKEVELKNNIEVLGDRKEALAEGGVTIEKQIKIYDEIVKGYKKYGCKSHHVIGVDCARSDSGVFRRPTTTGYVTQEQYYGSSYTHRGIDIGSKNKTKEKIYPIADGRIIAKYVDGWGALVVAIEHYSAIQGKYYSSLYAHLSSYAPGLSVGKTITSNQYIGYMGNTGKSSGVHLHLELFPCRLFDLADKNCSSWSKYYNFATNQLRSGYNIRKVITFPNGVYNSWSSR